MDDNFNTNEISTATLNEIVSNINSYSYDEISKIYDNLSQDATVVFSEQFSVVRDRKNFLENIEVNELIEKISELELEELETTRESIKSKKYTKQAYVQIDAAIENRRVTCLIAVLDAKVQGIDTAEREVAEAFANEVNDYKLPGNIAINYLNRAYARIDACEKAELDEACQDLEIRTISELEELLNYVRSSRFKPGNANSYSALVQERLESLYLADLDAITAEIDEADLGAAREISNTLEKYNCPQNIKANHRKKVGDRITLLLKTQFDLLVSDMEDKNLQELILLKTELSKNEYAQFSPEYYLHRADVLLGKFVYTEFDNILYGISGCSKSECLNKREEIKMYSLWSPASKAALDIVNRRILYLDLRDLANLCDDVNNLNREQVAAFRTQLDRLNLSDQAKKLYLDLLRKREENIALKMISTLAVKFNRIMTAQQININGMHISIEKDYLQSYTKFANTFAITNINEMPFFIIDSGLSLAMSINHVYYKTGGKLYKAVVKNIRTFEVVKNLIGDSLVISLKDGSKITVSGSINRKISAMFANILNEMVTSITDPERMRTFTPITYTTENIDITKFESVSDYAVNYLTCIREISAEIESRKSALGLGSGLCQCLDQRWAGQIAKMKNGLGVNVENRYAFLYDNTLLGSGKEGLIVGARGIYFKQANYSLVSIPVRDITGVRRAVNKPALEIKTQNNGVFLIDKALGNSCNIEVLAEILLHHVTNMQVLALISEREAEDAAKPVKLQTAAANIAANIANQPAPEVKPAPGRALNLGVVPKTAANTAGAVAAGVVAAEGTVAAVGAGVAAGAVAAGVVAAEGTVAAVGAGVAAGAATEAAAAEAGVVAAVAEEPVADTAVSAEPSVEEIVPEAAVDAPAAEEPVADTAVSAEPSVEEIVPEAAVEEEPVADTAVSAEPSVEEIVPEAALDAAAEEELVIPAEPSVPVEPVAEAVEPEEIVPEEPVAETVESASAVQEAMVDEAPEEVEPVAEPVPMVRNEFCTSCGMKLLPDFNFCTSCGAPIGSYNIDTGFMAAMNQADAVQPEVEPIAATEPIQEVEPIAAAEPIQEVELIAAAEPIQEVEPVAAAEPIQEVEPVAAAEPIQEVELIAAAEPIQEVEPIAAAEPIQEVEPIAAAEPIQEVEPIAAAEPIQEVEPIAAAEPLPEIDLSVIEEAVVEPQVRFCTACGAKTLSTAKFCTKCGNKL